MIAEPVISYWTTREIARGKEPGKTALASGGIFSIFSSLIYVVIAILYSMNSDANQNILIFGVLMVPVNFIRNVLGGINIGYKPQNTAYMVLVIEAFKIIIALILIYYLKMGVEGVILSIMFATVAGIVFVAFRSMEKLRGGFGVFYLKGWLKRFWLPIYPRISHIVLNSDVVVFVLIVGSVADLSYWGASVAVASVVLHSSKVSSALYGKLLEGGRKEYLQENLAYLLFVLFPMAGMAISFAEPALFALNPAYQEAVPIVVVLAMAWVA